MAGFLFDTVANKLLDYLFNATSASFAASFYCALFTAAPLSSGGGTEVTGGSYARQGQTRNTTNFPLSSSRTLKNATLIDFGTATAGWGTIVGAAWYDASTSGAGQVYGPFGTPVTVLSGGTFSIAINAMTATM